MTLKQRIEKLEQAALKDDDLRKVVLWRVIVTRSGDGLTEAVHSAVILGCDTAPGMRMERQPGESEQVFVRDVLDRACLVWGWHDEAFRDSIHWRPGLGAQ